MRTGREGQGAWAKEAAVVKKKAMAARLRNFVGMGIGFSRKLVDKGKSAV
jgi:hypothetical protein